jgi:hypothetical protein
LFGFEEYVEPGPVLIKLACCPMEDFSASTTSIPFLKPICLLGINNYQLGLWRKLEKKDKLF